MTIRAFLSSFVAGALLATTATAGSHDGTGYRVHIFNECPVEMRLAIRYLAPGYDWQADSWWTLKPNAGTYLSSDGTRILHQAGLKYLYVYAETTTGRGYFNTEPKPEDFNLIKIMDFRFVMGRAATGTLNEDTYEVRLNCNDS
jgi:uncharacterized membrane protein